MKFIFKVTLIILAFSTIFLAACGEDDSAAANTGEVSFGIVFKNESGRILDSSDPSKIIFSLIDNSGALIFEDEEINLSNFNDDYESDPISLTPGEYTLTKFVVLGEDDQAHYATPMEDSDLAYLVDDPLPIVFVVSRDEVTHVVPEVISTEEGTVEDFGYAEFGFEFVETFDLLISAFVYDESTEQYELATATLSIYNEEDSITTQDLFAVTNKTVFSSRFDSLTLIVDKVGFDSYNHTFSIDSLEQYDGTSSLGPIEVILSPKVDFIDGLVAYFPFNGNANDESGNGGSGIVNGPLLTEGRKGDSNSAYSFDGNDDEIEINGILETLAPTTSGSFSFWFKSSIPAETSSSFLSFGDTNERNFITIWMYDGYLRFSVAKNNVIQFGTFNDDEKLSPETWYHVVCVQDGIQPKLYLNGSLISTYNNTANDLSAWFDDLPLIDNSGVGFLDQNNIKQYYLDGEMDDVRIYSKALNQSEIDALYNE